MVDEVEVSGSPDEVDLGGGERGFDAPIRALSEDGASHCGLTPAEFAAIPFYVSLETGDPETIDAAGTPIGVTVTRSTQIDGAALTATCPSGTAYCSTGCVRLDTVANCGGCGRMPPEICDGLDSDCDGLVDDGCPASVTRTFPSPLMSPLFGTMGINQSAYHLACVVPNVATGIYGRETGNIRQIGFYCGQPTLRTDTTTTPYTFRVDMVPIGPLGLGGATGGPTGTTFDYPCPANMVLESVSGVVAANLGQIQAGCVAIDVAVGTDGTWGLVRGATATSSVFGSGAGTAFSWSIPASASGAPSAILDLFGYQHDAGDIAVIRVAGTTPRLLLR